MGTLAAPQGIFNSTAPRRIEHTRPGVSAFSLIVTYVVMFPLLFIAARGAFSVQLTGTNNKVGAALNPESGQGSALHSAELIGFYGIMLLVMYPVGKQVWKTCRAHWEILFLPILAMCSTAWSSEPARTLAFSTLSLVLTLFGVYLAVRFTPRQQLQLFMLTGLVAAVLSCVLAVAYPRAGIDYKNVTVGVEGIYPSKNACSGITILFLLPAWFYKFPGRWAGIKKTAYVLLHMTLIVACAARAGWGVLIILFLFTLLLRFMHRLRPIERWLVAGFTPAVVALMGWLVYVNSAPILKLLNKDPTLSGRTVIWSVAPLAIIKQPLFGFGYDAFWTLTNPEAHRLSLAAGDPFLNNAENGVLQMLLELGLVGMIAVLWVLIRATVNSVRSFRADTPNYALFYILITFLTLLSLVDGNKFMFPNAIEWPIFIMAYVGLENEARRVRAPQTTWA